MSVTRDGVGFLAPSSSSTVTSVSYTGITVGAGYNRALLVFVYLGVGTSPTGITCVWDSGGTNQSMTLLNTATTTGARILIFGLLNPVSGNKTCLVSWTTADTCCVAAMSFSGVLQTSLAAAFTQVTATNFTTSTSNPGPLVLNNNYPGNSNNVGILIGTIVCNNAITNSFASVWNGNLFGAASEQGEAESPAEGTGATTSFGWFISSSGTGSFAGLEIVPAPVMSPLAEAGVVGGAGRLLIKGPRMMATGAATLASPPPVTVAPPPVVGSTLPMMGVG